MKAATEIEREARIREKEIGMAAAEALAEFRKFSDWRDEAAAVVSLVGLWIDERVVDPNDPRVVQITNLISDLAGQMAADRELRRLNREQVDLTPYLVEVCPGCFAVEGPCEPGCWDHEMEMRREDAELFCGCGSCDECPEEGGV